MKMCYYRLSNVAIKMNRERYGVLAHIANRKEMLDTAIRTHIVQHVRAEYDYEPIAQPLDELGLKDQPYDPELEDALCLTSNLDIVVHHIKVVHPKTYDIAIEMPEDYNPLTNNHAYSDEILREFIQEAIDRYMPITFKTVEVR